MATTTDVITLDGLTLGTEEARSFADVIVKAAVNKPARDAYRPSIPGVQMEQQIVFASKFGKVGLKATGACGTVTSEPQTNFTEKFYKPVRFKDAIIHCNADLDGLFKMYFLKATTFAELYNIEGSDLEAFLQMLLTEAIDDLIDRLFWFGNENVAVSDATTAGLTDAANVKFYNYTDGIWQQIFAGVTAGDIARLPLDENDELTKEDQITLPAGRAIEIMKGMLKLATPELRNDPDRYFGVSKEIFEEYVDYMENKSLNFTLDYTLGGLPRATFRGMTVINFETVWDAQAREDFEQNSTTNAYFRPNRAILTTPNNLHAPSLEGDVIQIKLHYDEKEELNYLKFGGNMGANLIREDMIVAAY